MQSATEASRWTLRVQATDPDAGQTVRYALGTDAPAGVEIDAATGQVSWTPSEVQGPGTFVFTVRATDSGEPSRSGSGRVEVNVAESNQPPAGVPAEPVVVGEGSTLTLQLVATDPDIPAQALRFETTPGTPAGVVVGASNGILEWTPSEDQGPASYDFNIRVTDSFDPPGSALLRVRVTVNEVDNPPVFTQPQLALVAEGSEVVVQLVASDPDGAAVTFSLVNEPPPGLTLNPATGVIRWTPTELQGPGSYPLIVRATESTPLAQSAQATFSIQVFEANQPPRLGPIASATAFEGDVLSRNLSADDDDLPPQNLSFSLVGEPPQDVVIDPVSGRLTWAIPPDIGRTNVTVRVQVADDALPSAVAERSWEVAVQPRFKVAISEIMSRPAQGGSAYVELANPSATTAWDLSGCRLVGRAFSFDFPGGILIAPGEALCVVASIPAFRAAHGAAPRVVGSWTGSLGADGDDLVLFSMQGDVLDRVPFAVGGDWPDVPAAGGVALQLVDLLAENALPGAWTATPAFTGPRDLTTLTSPWRYLEAAPVGPWTTEGFDDRAWKSGPGLFYVESAALPAPKSTALNLGQWSYFFRTTFVLPSVPNGASLALTHVLDDGMVLYLNGVELMRTNMPAGVVTPTTAASVTVGDATSLSTTLPASLLRAGTNILAAEVHQSTIGSSDIVFGAALRLEGGTLPGNTPGSPNSVVATMEALPLVFLNEVAPRAGTFRDASGDSEPWIELLNAGTQTVALDGWQLLASTADAPWTFPKGLVLRAGERRVVVLDAEPSESTPSEWHATFRPAVENGWIALVRPAAVGSGVMDSFRYGSTSGATSWANVPEGQRFARMAATPTPGKANPTPASMAPTVTGRWNGNGLSIGWPSVRGAFYRVESSEDPAGGWRMLTRMAGNDGMVEVADPLPPGAVRFYRVVVEP